MENSLQRPHLPVLVLLSFSSLAALAFVGVRWQYSGFPVYLFLVWNLILAWAPLAAAWMVLRLPGLLPRLAAGALWLLFLPNAPYILTDLLHLGGAPGAPLWFDLLLLLVYAMTGLLLGFVSLAMLHSAVASRFGPAAGWCFATVSLALSSYGVYVGRFLRWNSWDLLLRPGAVLGETAGLLGDPRPWFFSLAFAGLLVASYTAFTLLPGLHDAGRRRPAG
jgi:uncharacterized membrane protein